MIFNVRNVYYVAVLLLICCVYSYSQPDNVKARYGKSRQTNIDPNENQEIGNNSSTEKNIRSIKNVSQLKNTRDVSYEELDNNRNVAFHKHNVGSQKKNGMRDGNKRRPKSKKGFNSGRRPKNYKVNKHHHAGNIKMTKSTKIKKLGRAATNVEYETSISNENTNEVGHSNQNKDDVLSGEINLSSDRIEGTVNIPSNDKHTYNAHSDENSSNKNDDTLTSGVASPSKESSEENNNILIDSERSDGDYQQNSINNSPNQISDNNNCWMNIDSKKHIMALNRLDENYKHARKTYDTRYGKNLTDNIMEMLVTSHGASGRALHQAEGDSRRIPAGINLGGHCMMKLRDSVLFFHRMKLRNSTNFTIDFLNTDLKNMELIARLSLNDLHLRGVYERAVSDNNPANLYFVPNVGEMELLLKSVTLKLEGRLRLLNGRIMVAHVCSKIKVKDVLMNYLNSDVSETTRLLPDNIEDYLNRLKTDLDLWLKDFFNDFFMYYGKIDDKNNMKVLEYEKKKTAILNEYIDDAISSIIKRIKSLNATVASIPPFTLSSVPNIKIKLINGFVQGLHSMYRRSVPTTKVYKNMRTVDAIIGFSNLKVVYSYESRLSQETPPLGGLLIMTSNELTGHLAISQVEDSKTTDISIDDIVETRHGSLTVEGPASRLVSNFKSLLERPIIGIMSNILLYNIKSLDTLTSCEPIISGIEQGLVDSPSKQPLNPMGDNEDDEKSTQPRTHSGIIKDIPTYIPDPSPEARHTAPEDNNTPDKDWSDYILAKSKEVNMKEGTTK